jgi:hypothetical protein
MDNYTILDTFKRESTWKLFFLSILTYGVYPAIYAHRQSIILNEFIDKNGLDEKRKLPLPLTMAFVIISSISLALFLISLIIPNNLVSGLASMLDSQLSNLYIVLMLVISFFMGSRFNWLFDVEKDDPRFFGGVGTFFLTLLYINFKPNKLHANNRAAEGETFHRATVAIEEIQ